MQEYKYICHSSAGWLRILGSSKIVKMNRLNILSNDLKHSWEGDRSDCYPERNIVNQGEAEVENDFFER
jgi:hypothetical protein